MTSHESHAVAGMEWSIDASRQTLISITNASPRPDVLTVQLFTSKGPIDLPALELRGGEIALLNMQSIAAHTPIGTTSGTFAVRGSHGSSSAFRLERLMATPTSLTADVGRNTADDPVAYIDTEGEERVLWIRTDTSVPAQSDTFPPEEAYVTLDLSTTARWSSGASATTDETNTTEYYTDDTDTLTIQQPPQPRVTVFIPIHRPPNVGELIARFYDPCANNYLLTFGLKFGLPASAYEIYNSFQYPICWWAPTCQGRCSVNLYRSIAATRSCYPAGQPYIQCFGLTANGKCVLPVAVCTPQAAAGFCT